MPKITQDQAIEIVLKLIEKGSDDNQFHTLWTIIDYIGGLGYTTVTETVEILESLNQEDEDVKELRRYLKL